LLEEWIGGESAGRPDERGEISFLVKEKKEMSNGRGGKARQDKGFQKCRWT